MPNMKHIRRRRPRFNIHSEWLSPFYELRARVIAQTEVQNAEDRMQRKAVPIEIVEIRPSPDDVRFLQAVQDFEENMARQLSLALFVPSGPRQLLKNFKTPRIPT